MKVIKYEDLKGMLKSNQKDLHLGTLKMLEALIGQNLDHEDLKNDLYNMKENKHYSLDPKSQKKASLLYKKT